MIELTTQARDSNSITIYTYIYNRQHDNRYAPRRFLFCNDTNECIAHRPTFDPARGKEAQRGPAYHQRLLPAHTQLKVRKPGQGGDADNQVRDLRAELLQAEAAHFAKVKGGPVPALPETDGEDAVMGGTKRQLEDGDAEDIDAKRRRVLEETRDIDADSEEDEEDSSDDSDNDEDETAELQRELEKIKRERAEKREQEVRLHITHYCFCKS